MAAENADIRPGETVAVWGCGPVGQFTIQSCWMMGAGRVIAIDRVPERLEMARTAGWAETIDFSRTGVYDALMEMTGGRGAFMNKGLAMKAGQTHMMRYMEPLLRRIEAGEIDPSFVITHRVSLDKGPDMYRTFRDKDDGCIKVVLKPWD